MTVRGVFAAAVLSCCVLGFARAAFAADQVIFVVRHAERADGGSGVAATGMMANDPPLSAAGVERARRLATLLASADVKRIFTTEFIRAKDTAAPLAEVTHVKAAVTSSRDPAALVEQVRSAGGNVLVVGHSNTIPELLKQLGVKTPIAIGDNEYDNLFVVVRPAAGEPTLIRLRY
jgi:broad specificity phosphatase PhoE